MGKNQNSDNEFWEEYEKFGKNFVGTAEDLDDMIDEVIGPRPKKKKNQSTKMRRSEDGN